MDNYLYDIVCSFGSDYGMGVCAMKENINMILGLFDEIIASLPIEQEEKDGLWQILENIKDIVRNEGK